jgi:hypothetical protein
LREKRVEAVVDRNEPEVVRNEEEEEDDGMKTGGIRGSEVAAKPERSEVAATTKGRDGGREGERC